MNKKKELIFTKIRNQYMESRKVLCTGNPNKIGTIANGIKEIYPDATFIHLSNGYDFNNLYDSIHSLKRLFQTHNTFINASYVDGKQIDLLNLCHINMKIGDVFNIGSTNEYDGLGKKLYRLNKLKLRKRSIELNSFKFQTCHIIVGGIDTNSPKTEGFLKPKQIAEYIYWITLQKFKVPLTSIETIKKPWEKIVI